MIVAVGVLAVIGLLFWYEDVRIRRFGGGGGERAAFAGAMIIATVVAVAVTIATYFEIPIPSPTAFIDEWLGGIGDWILPERA